MIRPALTTGLALVLALPPVATWLSTTMPRHQLIQVPALLLLGVMSVRWTTAQTPRQPPGEWDPALLILAIGGMIFWMIPRSVDLAASDRFADQLQHLSMFLAGIIFARTLSRLSVVAAMTLGIHGVAMLAAQGMVYTLYPGLICTAYTLQQQRTTGQILLYAAPVLGAMLWVWVLRRMADPAERLPDTQAANAR